MMNDNGDLVFWTLVCLGIAFWWVYGFGYRAGQLDAHGGEYRFELVTNDVGTVKWSPK